MRRKVEESVLLETPVAASCRRRRRRRLLLLDRRHRRVALRVTWAVSTQPVVKMMDSCLVVR